MRTRTRIVTSNLVPGGNILFSLNGDTPSWPGPPFVSADTYDHLLVEEIIDEQKRGQGTKGVDHKLWEFQSNHGSPWKYQSGSDVVEDTGPSAVWWGHGFYPSYNYPFDFGFSSPKFDRSVEKQVADTIEKFHSVNEVDNLLNIAEANQLPGTLRSLATTIDRDEVKDALRKKPRSVTKIGKRLSNSFLAYSFGLAPLLSDMRKMGLACKNLHSDMLKDRNRRTRVETVSTRHYGTFTGPHQADLDAYFDYRRSIPSPPVRICGVKGVRSQQYNTAVFSNLDYLLRKFGTPGPASFVWEKIPYSFMVDWFVNLKGITQTLDNLLTGNTKEISDAWLSVKSSEFYQIRIKNPNAISPAPGTTMASVKLDRYTRNPIIPSRPAVFVDSRFGKKQLALTGALLYQKVAKR